MSNKVVPHVYRKIIDDVIANVGVDFEEYGMDEAVIIALQAKWEAKLLQSRVADFARAPGAGDDDDDDSDDNESSRAGPSSQTQNNAAPPHNPYGYSGAPATIQNGYNQHYQQTTQQYNPGLALPGMVNVKAEPDVPIRPRGGAINDSPPLSETKPEPNAAGLMPGDEVINSDLDDSEGELDDDGEGDDEADVDIVFCVYDKVQRVKNKWKTVFKDGMIHINGRDYLFQKCNGEFEW